MLALSILPISPSGHEGMSCQAVPLSRGGFCVLRRTKPPFFPLLADGWLSVNQQSLGLHLTVGWSAGWPTHPGNECVALSHTVTCQHLSQKVLPKRRGSAFPSHFSMLCLRATSWQQVFPSCCFPLPTHITKCCPQLVAANYTKKGLSRTVVWAFFFFFFATQLYSLCRIKRRKGSRCCGLTEPKKARQIQDLSINQAVSTSINESFLAALREHRTFYV